MNDCSQVYWERNQLVCALSKIWPSRIGTDPDEPEWPVVYVDSPEGQLSWHVHAGEVEKYFSHLERDPSVQWDGHTAEEKYERLRRIGVLQSNQ